MNVGREIAAQMAQIEAEQVEEDLSTRYRRALVIIRTIPSGTLDADLTPEQAAALDEYEAVYEGVGEALTALREDS